MGKYKRYKICIICKSKRSSGMFKFPSKAEIRQKWLALCKIDQAKDHNMVCSDHFKREDFTSTDFNPQFGGSHRIFPDAIPSLNLPTDGLEQETDVSEVNGKSTSETSISLKKAVGLVCVVCSNDRLMDLFTFPSCHKLRRSWLSAFQMKFATENMRVCSKHFKREDFSVPPGSEKKSLLLCHAVPSLNLLKKPGSLSPKSLETKGPNSDGKHNLSNENDYHSLSINTEDDDLSANKQSNLIRLTFPNKLQNVKSVAVNSSRTEASSAKQSLANENDFHSVFIKTEKEDNDNIGENPGQNNENMNNLVLIKAEKPEDIISEPDIKQEVIEYVIEDIIDPLQHNHRLNKDDPYISETSMGSNSLVSEIKIEEHL